MLSDADRRTWQLTKEQLSARLYSATREVLNGAARAGARSELRGEVLRTITPIVNAYGHTTAGFSAQMYSLARSSAGFDDLFAPTPTFEVNAEQIESSTRWSLRPLERTSNWSNASEEDFRSALMRLYTSMDRIARKAEAQTVLRNCADDPADPRMRRVPSSGACPFCMMLASRGHVYSGETVLRDSEGQRYHDRCRCSAEPHFPGERLPQFVRDLESAWERVTNGLSGDEARSAWDSFVKDGGLGDRPIPGRRHDGSYRDTVDGKPVPITFSDIEKRLRGDQGLWRTHVLQEPGPRGRGGHLYEHAEMHARIARTRGRQIDKTLFPEGYTEQDFADHVHAVLRDPMAIEAGPWGNSWIMYREFEDITIAVQVAPGPGGTGHQVTSAYPVAGRGWRIAADGGTESLPATLHLLPRRES